jgi:hypothetical protein
VTWLVQNTTGGPVCIRDLSDLVLAPKGIKDLDVLGREIAERSRDILYLIEKKFVKVLRKDPSPSANSTEAILGAQQAVTMANEAIDAAKNTSEAAKLTVEGNEKIIQELKEQNKLLLEALKLQQEGSKQQSNAMISIAEEVKRFVEKQPVVAKDIAEAMRNIKTEKEQISKELQEIEKSEASENEMKTHEKILKMKGDKLDKNFKDLGKTVSKKVSESNVDNILDALDDIGI